MTETQDYAAQQLRRAAELVETKRNLFLGGIATTERGIAMDRERRNVFAALRRRGIRTDLELRKEGEGIYSYRGQSALCASLRTDLVIRKEGRRWIICHAQNARKLR